MKTSIRYATMLATILEDIRYYIKNKTLNNNVPKSDINVYARACMCIFLPI